MEEPVIGYATQDFCKVCESETVQVALDKMIAASCTESYVLRDGHEFLGKLIINDLINVSKTENVLSLIEKEPLTLSPEFSVLQSIEACRSFVGESIPIIERPLNKICGVISEADLFSAYLDLDKQMKDLENG